MKKLNVPQVKMNAGAEPFAGAGDDNGVDRRDVLKSLLATTGLAVSGVPAGLAFSGPALAAPDERIMRVVPKTGEKMPVIGMGTWITFNVGNDKSARAARTDVLKAFFTAGGGMIDSSPMYGSSQEVIGAGLETLGMPESLISATKVWTAFDGQATEQVDDAMELWGVNNFDVMQIHNLLNWKDHLETLQKMKRERRIRYIGITTSHGRRHDDFARIMRNEDIDFVQFTYNIDDREAEDELLPLAAERKLGVIINRPFQGGTLFDRYGSAALPEWAGEIGCETWAQFFLKFIISHPAVTVAIPATSRVDHMRENMGAGVGPLPDQAMRERMAAYVTGV